MEATVAASATDAVLKFAATDTLSGIDRYELIVDGGNSVKLAMSDIKEGKYTLSAQAPGEHNLTIKAYDKAGNYTSADAKFKIDGELPSTTTKTTADEAPKTTDWRLIADIGLIAFIAFLIGYLWYERKTFRREKYMAKRESDELRDNLGNIFAALREEVGEQVGAIFQRPNPSPQDREVMENINETETVYESAGEKQWVLRLHQKVSTSPSMVPWKVIVREQIKQTATLC